MSSRAKIDMSLGSPLCMKMREALWSAVACYRFRSGQLAGRGRVYRAFGERGREQARGIRAAASCRTPKVPAALHSCVFNRGFAYFHGREESASSILYLQKQILCRSLSDLLRMTGLVDFRRSGARD